MNDLHNKRSISSIKIMVEMAEEMGLSIDQSLANTGISKAQLDSTEAIVTGDQELQVIDNLVSAFPDTEGLGIQAGIRYQLTTFGIWAFAIISSPNIRSAIEVALEYADLSFVLVNFSYKENGHEGRICMDISHIPKHLHQFILERHMAILYVLTKETMGEHLVTPKRISLTIEEVPYADLVGDFFKDILYLQQQENYVSLYKEQLDMPLPKANASTEAFCLEQCQQLLNQRKHQAGFAGDVRKVLLKNIGNMPSLDEAASIFNMSSRTFRRRLSEEGQKYRDLLDETREGVAIELLETASLSVESVAERLGYSETSSFIHAFTRWTGHSPGKYKKKPS